jgi:hypothetical protein
MLVLTALAVMVGPGPVRVDQPPSTPYTAAQVAESLLLPTVEAILSPLAPPQVLSVDLRVGSPDVDYIDPEFWPEQNLMAWQDPENNIWLCRVDPALGTLLPADGRGQKLGVAASMIGTKVLPFRMVVTGPEWGVSQRGLGVYFFSIAENYRLVVTRVSVPQGVSEVLTPLDERNLLGVFPSTDADDPQSRLIYAQASDDFTLPRIWQEETDASTAEPFPNAAIGSNGPRWIPRARALVTNVVDADGVTQIARYDIDSRTTTNLTDGPGKKTDGCFFNAPEFDHESMFLCSIDFEAIGIYRQLDGQWTRIRTVTPPPLAATSPPLHVSSIEPAVYRGKSYIVYRCGGTGQSAACVASLDGKLNAVVSTPTTRHIVDTEAVVLGDALFVYYTIIDANPVELHACRVLITP